MSTSCTTTTLRALVACWILAAGPTASMAAEDHEAMTRADLAGLEGPLPITLEARATGPGSTRTFTFRTQSGTLTFLLRDHDVRSAGFQVPKQVAGGAYVPHAPAPGSTLRGVVIELPGAVVAASDLPEGLTAFVLDPGGTDLLITPQGTLDGAPSPVHVLTRWEGGGAEERAPWSFGDVGLTHDPLLLGGGEDCALEGFCVADLALDTDFLTFQEEGSVDRVVDVVEGILNMANLRYEDRLAIRHRITAVVVRTSQADDPYNPAVPICGVDAFGNPLPCPPLSRMTIAWTAPGRPNVARDSLHLFTKSPRAGVDGEGIEGGMCSSSQGRSYSRYRGLVCVGLGTAIHEIGHVWGASHSCGIMSVGGSDCIEPFCTISLGQITAKRNSIDGTCLDLETPDDSIFADAFEGGSLDGWSDAETDGGRLHVFDHAGVIEGSYSLGADLVAADPIWVRDDWPNAERRYWARFSVNTSGLAQDPPTALVVPPTVEGITIFEAASPNGTGWLTLELRQGTGIVPYEVRALARTDNGTQVGTPWTGVPSAGFLPFTAEVALRASSAPGRNDGRVDIWVDGFAAGSGLGLDNDQAEIDFVRLGVVEAIDHPSTRGFLVFDAFESRQTRPGASADGGKETHD